MRIPRFSIFALYYIFYSESLSEDWWSTGNPGRVRELFFFAGLVWSIDLFEAKGSKLDSSDCWMRSALLANDSSDPAKARKNESLFIVRWFCGL